MPKPLDSFVTLDAAALVTATGGIAAPVGTPAGVFGGQLPDLSPPRPSAPLGSDAGNAAGGTRSPGFVPPGFPGASR